MTDPLEQQTPASQDGGKGWTAGPWLTQNEFNGEWSVWTRQPHTGTICLVRDEDVNGVFPAPANARLIAAAPDFADAALLVKMGATDLPDDMVAISGAAYRLTLHALRLAQTGAR